MAYVGKIKTQDGIEYPIGSMLYGTCSTDASTQTKIVTMLKQQNEETVFTSLRTGITIHVYFSAANTHSAPKLKVDSTTAKNIISFESEAPAKCLWRQGSILTFTYDGDNWILNNGISVKTSINDASDESLLTAKAIKTAIENAKIQAQNAAITTAASFRPEINNNTASSNTVIYAPTTGAQLNQILVGNGTTAAPTWTTGGTKGMLLIGTGSSTTPSKPTWLTAPTLAGHWLRSKGTAEFEWTNKYGAIYVGDTQPGTGDGASVWIKPS